MRELLTDQEKTYLLEADTVYAADFCDASGKPAQELVIRCHPVPEEAVSGHADLCEAAWPLKRILARDGCYMVLSERAGVIKVPLIHAQLRHYFDDYRNYYYLPGSDEAMHKSVAVFVDRNRRVQAKADNCYMKLEGSFFPVFTAANDIMGRQVFRRERRERQAWLCLDDRTKADRDFFSKYATHLYRYTGRITDQFEQ